MSVSGARRVAVALLVMVVGLAGLPGVSRADDNGNDNQDRGRDQTPRGGGATPATAENRPDLKIEYAGFNAPGVNDALIKFKVTNVGKARSTAIKAKIVTLEPEPTPWQRDIDVPSLAPGASHELFYPLADSCKGHLVRATVTDPLDFPSVNDRVEVRVCEAPPPIVVVNPPTVIPTEDYGNSVNDGLPPHLRSGPKDLTFVPVETAVFGRVHRETHVADDPCFPSLPVPPQGLEAGFFNFDNLGVLSGCRINIIWQAGFRFDLTMLREARETGRWFPTDARLTFKETPYPIAIDQPEAANQMYNGEGDLVPVTTCRPRLAVPTVDWRGPSRNVLPNDVVREAGETGRWTVFDQALEMVVDPDREHRGFLILGHSESMDSNYAVCRSRIEDVTLTVSYTMR